MSSQATTWRLVAAGLKGLQPRAGDVLVWRKERLQGRGPHRHLKTVTPLARAVDWRRKSKGSASWSN